MSCLHVAGASNIVIMTTAAAAHSSRSAGTTSLTGRTKAIAAGLAGSQSTSLLRLGRVVLDDFSSLYRKRALFSSVSVVPVSVQFGAHQLRASTEPPWQATTVDTLCMAMVHLSLFALVFDPVVFTAAGNTLFAAAQMVPNVACGQVDDLSGFSTKHQNQKEYSCVQDMTHTRLQTMWLYACVFSVLLLVQLWRARARFHARRNDEVAAQTRELNSVSTHFLRIQVEQTSRCRCRDARCVLLMTSPTL